MFLRGFASLLVVMGVFAHSHADFNREQASFQAPEELWASKYGKQIDLPYTGPLSFAHLPYERCLDSPSTLFDIAILGFPFDTATSYRPGARFGPYSIRSGARRQYSPFGYTLAWGGENPYELGASLLDCGDVPLSAFSNDLAIDQMEAAYSTLIEREVAGGVTPKYKERTKALAKDGKEHPRIVTLGGDHTIVSVEMN
jgi:agmatinase